MNTFENNIMKYNEMKFCAVSSSIIYKRRIKEANHTEIYSYYN